MRSTAPSPYLSFFPLLLALLPALSAISATCNVKNTWTIPATILINWLHSVGPKMYTNGDKSTHSDAAINNPHTQYRAFTEKALVLQMGMANIAKPRIVMHELWIKNQKSASCVVPRWWGEYCHPRAAVGMVVRNTRRLSHRALEICCCRMVNNSVFGVQEGWTYVQSRRQFTFFFVMFEHRRELLPILSQPPFHEANEASTTYQWGTSHVSFLWSPNHLSIMKSI